MTPLHSMIKNALLPVLLENTKIAREKQIQVKEFVPDPEITKIVQWVRSDIWSYESTRKMFTLFRPDLLPYLELIKGAAVHAPLTNLSVILYGEKPYVVTHGTDFIIMNDAGKFTLTPGKYPLASDEEVESCLDNLNGKQLKTVMSLPLFAPILAGLFEEETELVKEEERDLFDIKVGDKVVRGPDWKWGEQDLHEGNTGVVDRIGDARTPDDVNYHVAWNKGNSYWYANAEGHRHLQLAP